MKILHLLDEKWDSGITHYALQIALLLKQAGHQVTVGVLSGKKPEKFARQLNLETAPINTPLDFYKLIRGQSWDVINPHTGRSHTWSLLLAGKQVPIVRTRGDARPVKPNVFSKFVYSKTAAVIAASAHIAAYYERGFGLSDGQLEVIYPFVKIDEPPLKLPNQTIGILGRLDPVKGHSFFLEAASHVLSEFPEAKFLMAGKEANISYELLRNQINELGIAASVEYVGYVESSLHFMHRCGIGVIASLGSEEISRAGLEWMGAGRPVVGTLVGCLSEIIEPEENGYLVVPGDGIALGEAILKLLRDPKKMDEFGHNSQKLARQKFNSAVCLEKTVAIYSRGKFAGL